MPAALLDAQAVTARPAILAIVEIDVEQCLVRAADGDERAFVDPGRTAYEVRPPAAARHCSTS